MIHSFNKTLLGSGALASLLLSASLVSCQDEDFGYTAEQIAYETNFRKAFGEVDPDQSWDLTYANQNKPIDLGMGTSSSLNTRAGISPTNASNITQSDGWYYVENNTIDWMNEYLQESRDNRNLGSKFVMTAPGNDFDIIPIYQGKTGMKWSLYTKVDDYDLSNIWQQSQNIQAKFEDSGNFLELGWTDDATFSKDQGKPERSSSTIGAKAVRAKPMHFSGLNGKNMHLSLHIDMKKNGFDDSNTWATVGTYQASLSGMMLALNCPRPTNVGTTTINGKEYDNQVMIIGCEDANGSSSDWDMNDVVFLVVGYPNVPTVRQKSHHQETLYGRGSWQYR